MRAGGWGEGQGVALGSGVRVRVVRIEAAHPVAACASDARVARMRDAPVGREEHLVAEVLELGRSEAPPLDELLHLPSPRCRQRDGENVLRLLATPGEGEGEW